MSNFFKRSVSSIFIVAIIWFCSFKGGLYYLSFVSLISIAMICEGIGMLKSRIRIMSLEFWEWASFFLMYIVSFSAALSYLRFINNGYYITMYLFITVWLTDTFAYVFGTRIGGAKLMPSVSPSKTWSGFVFGVTCPSVIWGVLSMYCQCILDVVNINIILLTFLISVSSQLGDLLESALKRRFGVKDSGSLIPGHGGVLDRFDGVMLASFSLVLLISLFK